MLGKNGDPECKEESYKPLCARGLSTREMCSLLEISSKVSIFKSYPFDQLTNREVEAIMIIKDEDNKIEDENIEKMKHKAKK